MVVLGTPGTKNPAQMGVTHWQYRRNAVDDTTNHTPIDLTVAEWKSQMNPAERIVYQGLSIRARRSRYLRWMTQTVQEERERAGRSSLDSEEAARLFGPLEG